MLMNAMKPAIATTVMSSSSVKPSLRCNLFMVFTSTRGEGSNGRARRGARAASAARPKGGCVSALFADPEKLARLRPFLHNWSSCLVKRTAEEISPLPNPLGIDRTRKTLAELQAPLARAIAAARTRDIDEQQVAVARLSDLATKLRAAQDLAAYAGDGRRALPRAGGGVRRQRRLRGRPADPGLRPRARAVERGPAGRRGAGLRARGARRGAGARDRPRRGRGARAQRLPARRDARPDARRRALVRGDRGRAARRAHPPQRRDRARGVHREDGRARLLRAVDPRAVRRRRDGQRRHGDHDRGALARLARRRGLADHAPRDPRQGAARGRHRGRRSATGCRRSPRAS